MYFFPPPFLTFFMFYTERIMMYEYKRSSTISSTIRSSTDSFGSTTNATLVESFDIPYEYIPCLIAIIIVLIYSLAVRLAYTLDYKMINEGDLIILENQSKATSLCKDNLYLIFIDTGFWANAGTKAHVRLEIHAKNFCSRVYCLRASCDGKKILQRGRRDIFVLNNSESFGDILSLTLLVITLGEEVNWYLERIKIIDVSQNRKWIFPCYRWLSSNHRPSFKLQLSPRPAEKPDFKRLLQSRGVEINTWTSMFISYNRLGRLCRIERITICASNTMSILFAYVAIMQTDFVGMLEAESESEWILFVLLCCTVFLLLTVMNYLPEIILRNSMPVFGPFEAASLCDSECVECNKRTETTSAACVNEITQSCKICCLDNAVNGEEDENKGEFDEGQSKFSQTPRELIGDVLCTGESKTRPRLQFKDLNLITKYYELAAKYVRFFDTWSGFCDKFCDVIDDLRAYKDSFGECEVMKHRRCVIWLLDGMEGIQDQFCIMKKFYKTATNDATLPENILFPEKCRLVGESHQTVRLMRLTVFLMLIKVIDWSESMKNIQMNTLNEVPFELTEQLHHIVSNLFYALDVFVLKRNQLYLVCNRFPSKKINTLEMFICIYVGDSEQCDFEICPDVDDKDEYPLNDIRNDISDFSDKIVSEAICGIVHVSRCRRPLNTFVDYMRYHTNQNDSFEWASVCVDFSMPLIAVFTKPLIFYVKRFTCQIYENTFACVQIQQYIQTVITNAALQILRQVKRKCKTRLRDPFQAMSSAEMCCPQSEDICEACSEYAIAVDRFRHCLQSNRIVNQLPDKCCPEGKVHIEDINVLKFLLEEGKLKAGELACRQMIESMEKLVGSYYDKLVIIDKFMFRALLTLTDSHELLCPPPDPCSICQDESAEFILKIRLQIQQMSFIVTKLLHRSKDKATQKAIKQSPNLYWTSKGYVDQPFIKTVESFKHEITCDQHPFSNPEVIRIQAIAFNIHKMSLPIYWTFATYVYILFQNVLFLALILKWAERMSKASGLGSIVFMIIGLIFEIIIAQLVKMLITSFLMRKYMEIEIKETKNSSEVQS
uniref:PLAT domain-containing protein n=1 Tax=Strigamia maritima TaxID=126957 RepID=T1IVS1_STRMM